MIVTVFVSPLWLHCLVHRRGKKTCHHFYSCSETSYSDSGHDVFITLHPQATPPKFINISSRSWIIDQGICVIDGSPVDMQVKCLINEIISVQVRLLPCNIICQERSNGGSVAKKGLCIETQDHSQFLTSKLKTVLYLFREEHRLVCFHSRYKIEHQKSDKSKYI